MVSFVNIKKRFNPEGTRLFFTNWISGVDGWVAGQVKLYSHSFGLPLGFPFGQSVAKTLIEF